MSLGAIVGVAGVAVHSVVDFGLHITGGAVASFVSSGLTIPDGQHAMGQRLFQLLYGSQPIALGDATRQAKLATTDLDVRRTWILLGDPTIKIR